MEYKERIPNYESRQKMQKNRVMDEVKRELNRVRNYTPKVGIFGDTGVGKSSLCNALFGKEIAKISDVEACTREPQEVLVGNKDGSGGIILVDVPGVGEDTERHNEYIELYKSLVPNLDLVIWAIKSDDRKYMSSINVYNEVLKDNVEKCPVIFAITQVDKIEPYREWDVKNNKPGEKQYINLISKINDISSKFDVSANKIVAISSSDSYNLVELVNKVVEVLPNEKKYSFTREAKDENVSDEATRNAEKGIIDHIKEKFIEAWDYIKDDVFETAKESIIKHAPHALNWIKNLFR